MSSFRPRRVHRRSLTDANRRALVDGSAGGSPLSEDELRDLWRANRDRLMDEPAIDGRPDGWWAFESGAPDELAMYEPGYPPGPPFGSLEMPPDPDRHMAAIIITRRRRKAQHEARLRWLADHQKELTT
jgi:hypothetical protein